MSNRGSLSLIALLLFYLAIVTAVVVIAAVLIMTLSTDRARAETCYAKPDGLRTERRGGYKWMFRNVDGRRCWYYSSIPLPSDELVWTYTEKEFNSDIDRVIERKFYRPEELEER